MKPNTFKALRLYLGMTQEEFGEFLGIGQSSIANMENGRRTISDATRGKIARKVDMKEFYSFLSRLDEVEKTFPK